MGYPGTKRGHVVRTMLPAAEEFSGQRRTVVVQSIQPHRAVIRGEGPLPDDYRDPQALHQKDVVSVHTSVLLEPLYRVSPYPGLIDVCVDGVVVTITHEVLEVTWRQTE